jgi:hypothetical protein
MLAPGSGPGTCSTAPGWLRVVKAIRYGESGMLSLRCLSALTRVRPRIVNAIQLTLGE